MHVLEDVAFNVLEALPNGHFWQPMASFKPKASEKRPF
jgi:hypothetical protein